MPRTGTTLCHPQNWLCRCDAQLSFLHLALNSPLGHFNGDNVLLSTRRTKLTVTPKFNSFNGNMAFAKLRRTQSLARPATRTAFLNFLITPFRLLTHNLPTRLAAQTLTTFSMLQNKKLFLKTYFDYRHLTSSSLPLLPYKLSEGPYTLSEETTQRKHTHARYTIFLAKHKQIFPPHNKKT